MNTITNPAEIKPGMLLSRKGNPPGLCPELATGALITEVTVWSQDLAWVTAAITVAGHPYKEPFIITTPALDSGRLTVRMP